MKKLLGFLIAVVCFILIVQTTKVQASGGEVVITCPTGDAFKCYTTQSGVTAYKGEGEAKVTIR